jgi:aminopeptidase N
MVENVSKVATKYLKDYSPPDFLVPRVHLHVDLRDDQAIVKARLEILRNGRHDRPLVLNGEALELLALSLDERPLGQAEYELDSSRLAIALAGDRATLETKVRINPGANTALEGLYRSNGTYCTQCEAEGFRKITYFIDRPDVMARFTTTIEADAASCPVLLSNGNPVNAQTLPNGRHVATWDDPFPKPCYLFALVAGDLLGTFDRFTTRSGRSVTLGIYVRRGDEDKCAHAMQSLKNAMRWDEEEYGREYELDVFNIVAVSDFNMGAMENTGLNIFNTKYVLANRDTAVDADFQNVEGVIGHEYFHNWTGNRITCRDWFQLSLKEGLTVFRDQQFSAAMGSAADKRIADVQALRRFQFPEDAGPTAHAVRPESYIEINNFYTPTVYEKGAEIVGMMHTLLGPERFRAGMDEFFRRHDGQAVTVEDFLAAIEAGADADLSHFALWYAQAGTPRLHARGTYDAARKTYTLSLKQQTEPTPGQPEKKPLVIPVALGLLGPDGRDMPLILEGENTAPHEAPRTRVVALDRSASDYTFTNLPAPPVPSLLRGFSAPVKLDAGLSREALRFLLAHDSDSFNRWEAGQELAKTVMLEQIARVGRGEGFTAEPAYFGALEAIVGEILAPDEKSDMILLSRLLAPPSENDLAQEMAIIDVDAIHAVVRATRREIGRRFAAAFEEIYERARGDGEYSLAPREIARRAIRNLALAYLVDGGTADAVARAYRQFESADNMTDRLSALLALIDTETPERGQALRAFYERFRGDALVIDKWFSIQALSTRPDTLEQVRALMQHPDFTLRNPNRLRALIGSFSTGNAVRFHERNGGGYALLFDVVMRLDRTNPQTAARLMGAFRLWRRFDERRQQLMRSALEEIARTPNLSSDLYEVTSKTLA